MTDAYQPAFARPGVRFMLQLNPPIPLDTPKGKGFAHLVTDYGQEHNLLFVCFINETGECWTFSSRDVRLEKNITMGVRVDEMPAGGHNRLTGMVG